MTAAGRNDRGKLSEPRVSVITIFYNAEAFLGEAIESVLAQDFRDFDYLLVDDGSTDRSSEIALAYAERDPTRIRCLHHPGRENCGMSAARNLGVDEAGGEFVAFIDADDRWRPSKLREQIALLDRMPDVDAIGGSVNYWASHEGGKDRIIFTGHVRNRPIRPPEALIKMYPIGRETAPSMSDLLFRRSSIIAAGGFEERFKGAYEDQAFLAKFYLGSTLYVTDAVWSDYRLHPASCMAEVERKGTYHATRRAFLEWFEGYLARGSAGGDPRIRRALDRALRPYRPKASRLRRAARAMPFAVPLVRAARSTADRLRPWVAPGPAILMYHRIAEESFDPWELAVSPDNFAGQLAWIARNRTVLPLAEFAELHRDGRLPRDAVALTFDDGYVCNAQAAKARLEQFRIPATIFLPTDLIARGREFWWDELERIVLGHEGEVLSLDGMEIDLGQKQPDDGQWLPAQPPRTPRQCAYHRLWSMLYAKPPQELESAMERLREQAGVPTAPRDSHRPMTPDEIRAIRSELIDFGAHALDHASLPRLDAAQKRIQIGESAARCAELTGSQPHSFAYPYGDHDPESARMVEEAGFLCACKADGWFVSRKTNRFALPRLLVGNWDAGRLARQLGRP